MAIRKEISVGRGTGLRLVEQNSLRFRDSRVLRASEVMEWSEERCKSSLRSFSTDAATALMNAAIILKVMVEKKYDTSSYPSTWVRAMLKIADGTMLPEVMRDFDGAARNHVGRMPLNVQSMLCEDSSVTILTEFGKIKKEKIQNLNMKEIRLALGDSGPRTIEEQRELISTNDERPEAGAPTPGTFEDAINYFQASRAQFGHLQELSSLYSMIEILGARLRR